MPWPVGSPPDPTRILARRARIDSPRPPSYERDRGHSGQLPARVGCAHSLNGAAAYAPAYRPYTSESGTGGGTCP
jgi:hypothetical protein